MDRAETTGLGVAIVGHVALFGLLTYLALTPPELPKIISDPIEVDIVSEVELASSAPAPSPAAASAPPAPAQAEPEPAPPEPVSPPPPPVAQPQPLPKPVVVPKPIPVPKPVPKPVAKPTKPPLNPVTKPVTKPTKPVTKPTKPTTADTRDRRRPGLSRDVLAGLSDTPNTPRPSPPAAKPTTKPGTAKSITPAAMSGPQRASLFAVINSQLRPHWKPPTGADAELLVTRLSVRLNRDGSIIGSPEIDGQDGVNDSNRAQAKTHGERAIQAVRRAAPFKNLPPEFYDSWNWLKPLRFDGKLAR